MVLLLSLVSVLVVPTVGFGAGIAAGDAAEAKTNATETEVLVETDSRDDRAPVELIVQFEAADRAAVQSDGTDALKAHSSATQSELERLADRDDEITIKNQFWLANAALVEIDTEGAIKSIAALDDVTAIRENRKVEIPDAERGKNDKLVTATSSRATTGLEQIDAPAAWDEFDTRGENVSVAVLDTGIDVDHPDLELKTNNESDPTYPGGWAEFDSGGEIVEGSQPYESDHWTNHGTHVSGTVAGGNESGTYVGVAPDVDLMHGLVLPDYGTGTTAQTIAGMEWAVENDADVIVTSLSTVRQDDPYTEVFIEPVQNARDAGVAVVTATGNQGADTSGAPANVYESVSVGAVDKAGEMYENSSGEVVETDADWEDPPESWPNSYTVPDVTAPGVHVESTVAGGGYAEMNGTSMATPHVGGIYALAISNDDGLENDEIQHALEETAVRPDGDEIGPRYGHGIVNARETLAALADGGVTGTVTDETGDPIPNATVTTADGVETTTDEDGRYEIALVDGTYDVTADAFGYENGSTTVTVEDDATATADFTLEPEIDGAVVDDQPSLIETGDAITTELDVANLESLVVDSDDLETNETLIVDGEPYGLGEEIPFEADRETITVALETTTSTPDSVALEYTLSGSDDVTTLASGPTTVVERIVQVGVIDDSERRYAGQTASILEEELHASDVSVETSDAVVGAEEPPHDVYVVQTLSEANAEEFVEATNGADVGVVYLDQWGDDANGIPMYASVTGDPGETRERDSVGTTVESPVNYIVSADHPIVADRTVGDEIPVHSGEYAEHTWFEETEFDVLAEVSHGGTDDAVGPALAVDDESNTVLASSLARTLYVSDDDFADEADSILVESTAYAVPDAGETGESGDPVVRVDDVESFVDDSESVTVDTSADGVAGYQLTLEYDPDVVQVTAADGGDFDAPVTNVDNETGTVSLAQTGVSEIDEPTLAELELEFVGEQGAKTALEVNESVTKLSDARGDERSVDADDGVASTLACLPGDVSGDGEVTIGDATMTQQYIVGNPVDDSFEPACADLTRDDAVTSGDVTLILEEIVGLEQAAPLEG